MRKTEVMRKALSILLTFCMVLSCVPTTAFAVTEDGLCEHHAEHTAECGYAEAVAGADCAHVHDTAVCGYVAEVQEVLCTCAATDESGALIHTEGCGYIPPVAGADCTHTHDDNCGYVEAVTGVPCAYECAECAAVTTYSVTIAEGITNGTVTPDKTTAAGGETVTLTVIPAEGYELDALTVTYGVDNTAVIVAEDNTFSMPAGDVTVTATFKSKAAEPVETNTIYFDNSVALWSTVYACAWESETGTSCLGPWPGTAMTPVAGETAIYSVAVPAGAEQIIFSNGSAQTGDQILGTGNCFKAAADGSGSWYTYPCTHANRICTDNGDGTHSGTCPDCGADTGKAAHTPENGKCTGCGGAFWTIRVIVGANREDTYIVPAGKDATLNGVYVEEGYVLEGVEVSYTDTYAPVTGFRCDYETITIPGEYVTADLTVGVSVRTLDIENAHNHVYVGVPTFTWAEDPSAATATWVCLADAEMKTLDCTVTYQTQNATCTEEGKTTYTAAVTWNDTDYTDTKTVSIPVDANNHTYDPATGKCVCSAQAEAKVGDTVYATLAEALTAAQGIENSTVTLLADVTGKHTVGSGIFTLDLNGKTINGQLTVENGANLTIADRSEAQTGIIKGTENGVYNFYGTVTITGGTVDAIYYGVYNYGTVNVKGGTISGGTGVVNSRGTVNVEGGTIDAHLDFENFGEGSVTLTGGIFPGDIEVEGYGASSSITLKDLLGEGCLYYIGDAVQDLGDDATVLAGDVTVKPCDHPGATYTDHANGTHSFSCPICGANVESAAHTYSPADCTTPATCSVCGATDGEALGHTPKNAVEENLIKATCETEGSFDMVVYCEICGEELERTSYTSEATDHADTDGDGDHVCDYGCGAADVTEHTPGSSELENWVNATCTEGASYDLVQYCTECDTELSREHRSNPAPGHSWIGAYPTWADDFSSCTAHRICADDDTHSEIATATKIESTVIDPASCTEEGMIEYKAYFEEEWVLEIASYFTEVDWIPITAHSEEYTYTDNGNCTHNVNYTCHEGVKETVEHTYTGGTCVCSAVQMLTLTVNSNGGVLDEEMKELLIEAGCTVTDDSVIMSAPYGEELEAVIDGLTKEGHTLTGFIDQNGKTYAIGEGFTLTEDMTMTAQWEETMHTVTFVYGMGNLSKQTIGEVTPQALNPYTGDPRTGHTFNGWNTKSDGSGTAYTDGQEITLTGDIMLYPQWQVTTTRSPGTWTAASAAWNCLRPRTTVRLLPSAASAKPDTTLSA